MTNTWQAVRRFLTAEEVPRWFGLSLVLIYLVGLGTVARVGISLARRDAAESFVESSRYAVTLLADRIAFDGEALASEAARLSAFSRARRSMPRALVTRLPASGAMGGEPRRHVKAGRRTHAVAALLRQNVSYWLRILAAQRFTGQNHDTRIYVIRM